MSDGVPEFFVQMGHALAVASERKQIAKKANNDVDYKFWNTLHLSLTKICADSHSLQYERMQNAIRSKPN